MSRIIYLVASKKERGIKDAEALGAVRIADTYFAMPDKDQLVVVTRFVDLKMQPGVTRMIKGSDFDEMPEMAQEMGREIWQANHDDFVNYVRDGHGEWVE